MSGNNRNARILRTIKLPAVRSPSLLPHERLAPGVILGWTAPLLLVIVGGAVGRIGLRRSATRAPAGPMASEQPMHLRPRHGPPVIQPTLLTPITVTSYSRANSV